MRSLLTIVTPDEIIKSLNSTIGHYQNYIDELKKNHRGKVTELRIEQIQEQIVQLEKERASFERLKEESNG